MKLSSDDLNYLCKSIGSLAGIPVRAYKGKKLACYYSLSIFPKDPISPYESKILSIEDSLGYFITPYFQYFGIVKSKDVQIVLGPTSQVSPSKKDLQKLAFECDVPADETNDFLFAMGNLLPFPLESLLQTMCSINFLLNGEKKTIADITIYDEEQTRIEQEFAKKQAEKKFDEEIKEKDGATPHNTLFFEETLLNYVRHGETSALKEFLQKAPAVSPGILSPDALRQTKNTFIVTTTLVSRAAIRGGLDANEALSLSDSYIQKCELLSTFESLKNLQVRLVLDFTERVEKLKLGENPTKLFKDVSNYAQKHLSEPISVASLASSLYLSRTYLAAKFKEETGMTLSEFLLGEKIEEGKRLLRYTDKSIASIASYLGFSSQGHFANAFRKSTGLSPKEYRQKHAH